MKKALYLLAGVILLADLQAQVTVTLQCSKDAALGYHDGANTAGNNYGSASQNAAFVIPAFANPQGTNGNRALIDFPLSSLPAGAGIISASLNLYATGPLGTLSGHLGTANQCLLQRVTQSWQENVVTWNNQPPATSVNQVTLQQSTSATQNYLSIDATALIKDAWANPSSSHGFLLRLVTEAASNGLLFVSRENSNPAVRPTLIVTYTTCEGVTSASSGPVSACAGGNFTLTASAGGGTPVWYDAQSPSVSIATGTSVVIQAPNVTSSTVFTYEAGNSNCPELPRSSAQVTVHPLPVLVTSAPATVCARHQATLSVNGASGYTWTGATGPVSSNSAFVTIIKSTVTYTVTGINTNGCKNESTVSIKAVECVSTSIAEGIIAVPLEVFPNPSKGRIFIKSSSTQELDIELYNSVGAKILSAPLKPDEVFELQGLSPGAYYFRASNLPYHNVKKLIITH